mgnify:CR=1 FL=1
MEDDSWKKNMEALFLDRNEDSDEKKLLLEMQDLKRTIEAERAEAAEVSNCIKESMELLKSMVPRLFNRLDDLDFRLKKLEKGKRNERN